MFLSLFDSPEGPERGEGHRRGLGSLDEDDPNILLAIQLSLQESRRERGLEGGMERGMEGRAELDRGLDRLLERRPDAAGDLADVSLHSLNIDGLPGARGSSFATSLLDPPRPPNRTDSTSQPPMSSALPLPPPPPSLSAELLELGDSLMKLGNITTPYDVDPPTQEQLCSHHTYSHTTLTPPFNAEPAYSAAHTAPYILDRITDPHHDSKEQTYCHTVSSRVAENALSPAHRSSYNHEQAANYDSTVNPDRSYSPCPEHSRFHPLEHPPAQSDLQQPAPLCLPSPDLAPELLLSPVIPPGGPFTPSDPQSLETLDPTASAQLLDNIMAWFNHNINPQNNPQSLALIPSPPTTETESSPDTHTETESENQTSRDPTPVPIWQPLEGEPEAGRWSATSCLGAAGVEGQNRPKTLDLENRETVEEEEEEGDVDAGCVADLSLDEARTHLRTQPQHADSPAHTAAAAERDSDVVDELEGDRSPEEWEEQVHLV